MNAETRARQVLLIDDQIGDIVWLIDRIEDRGYRPEVATNEKEARTCLEACARGEAEYAAVIVDVMLSIAPLEELAALDEEFYQRSQDTGIRLCQFAKNVLKLQIPIACLTVREDEEVKTAMGELRIPLYNRTPETDSESIDRFLEKHLRKEI